MRNFLATRKGQAVMVVATLAGVLGLSGVAGATTYDPTASLTSFADTFGTTLGPIVLAVAGAVVGIAILFWGIKFVFGFIHARVRA